MTNSRVRPSVVLVLAMVSVAGWLGACATGTESPSQPRRMPRFELPQQPEGSVRLYIFRPQGIVGMWGRPVILINGQKLVSTLTESLLDPNSVVVADVPADRIRVTWMQSSKSTENTDPLVLAGPAGSSLYLRWTLKPTSGHLQQVSESEARSELSPLFFKGYRNLTAVVK